MVQYNALYAGSYNPKGEHLIDVAGAESNVALNLSRILDDSINIEWISRLGKDASGELILQTLSENIKVSASLSVGEFTGVSFLTHHDDGRHEKVYKRAGSAASKITYDDVKPHLSDVDLLHVTGITPALSQSCRQAVISAMEYCSRNDIPVCLDVNYREQLWEPNEARGVLDSMLDMATILKLGHDEAESVWQYGLSAEEYAKRFHQGLGTLTIMTKGAEGAILYDGQSTIVEPALKIDIVDPVGAGDAFMAGFIGEMFKNGRTPGSVLDYGNRDRTKLLRMATRVGNICGSLTCTRRGDTTAMPNLNEINSYLIGG